MGKDCGHTQEKALSSAWKALELFFMEMAFEKTKTCAKAQNCVNLDELTSNNAEIINYLVWMC